MALLIQTTGLEQYAPGGTARVKVLVIGGPGVGKTRWASYFPQPIYADCERGLASVADRNVPFVDIKTSQDMLDLLAYLKQECQLPPDKRKYNTVVIDTLDAFARKIKNEWQEKERKQAFSGWEAWGYLNGRMQMLLTRLLNLDLNVVVAVHFKDKTTKDDETGRETHELMPQLQGESADNIFNDFDLVAWMGTYWEPNAEGERVQKRGLTFRPTPDKPFLKDRLHVTPPWIEVTFEPSDYNQLFEPIQAKAKELSEGATVGEVPTSTTETPTPAAVVAPGQAGSGALPPQMPRDIPYAQMDRPTLVKKCRDLGISNTINGAAIRANTVKSELIAALELHKRGQDSQAEGAQRPEPPTAAATGAAAGVPAPRQAPDTQSPASQRLANPERTKVVAEGTVNTDTGELVDEGKEANDAIELVTKELGGEVIEDKAEPVAVEQELPAPAPEPEKPKLTCADCGRDLADQNPDVVKLSYIRFRKRYCEEHYASHKTSGR